jgi:transcriptional regulator with XRE-family HTH domain
VPRLDSTDTGGGAVPIQTDPTLALELELEKDAVMPTYAVHTDTHSAALQSVLLGPRIKHYRQQAGLSQAEVARRLGCTPSMPSRWECEQATRYSPVPGGRLPALADLFNVPLEELAPEAMLVQTSRGGWADALDQPANACGAAWAAPSPAAPADQPPEGVWLSHGTLQFTTSATLAAEMPSPVPGRPDAQRPWRIRCWRCCHLVVVETAATRAGTPLCDWCAAPLRARTRVTTVVP